MEKKLKEIIALTLRIEEHMINEESSSKTIDAWDSLNHMNLIVAIEEEFDISFDDEAITDLTNYKSLLNYLKSSKV